MPPSLSHPRNARSGRDHQRPAASIAAFKVPKAVVFVDELPRNTMGKVQKKQLRDTYNDLLSVKLNQSPTMERIMKAWYSMDPGMSDAKTSKSQNWQQATFCSG